MGCLPEKPIPNLRRHNTSPGAAGRSIIASMSGGRAIKKQSHPSLKSNPYVGWFRHSPSTTPRFQASKKSSSPWCVVLSSLEDMKNSPHIGWFRHAPPSSLKSQLSPAVLSDKEKDLLWKLLQQLSTSVDNPQNNLASGHTHHLVISGHLRGGGRKYMEKSRTRKSNSHPFVRDWTDSSTEGTLSTVNALSRLASWFLFPVAHDAESAGYRSDNYPQKKKNKPQTEESLLGHLLSPYLPSFLEEPDRNIPKDVYAKYGPGVNHESDSELDSDESSSESDSSTSSLENVHQSVKSSRTKDLSLSISSLAEAYYAHQTATKEFGAASDRLATSLSAPGPVSPHRLDYVITQMDIARMTRNASRHLDVQSILGLPVITYKKGVKAKTAAAKSKMDQAGWSWTIVEESEGESDDAESSPQSEEVDFCVICLEHFVNGDRLRVLPCDHSFHVGCIDRWLSGSQSFEECYTSGCPTCKKRPTMEDHNTHTGKPRAQSFCGGTANIREGKHRSASLDGSVPSWAFAQIGSALVAQQDQGISICSGASHSDT